MTQRRLAYSGHVLDQKMAPCQKTDNRQPNRFRLASDYFAEDGLQSSELFAGRLRVDRVDAHESYILLTPADTDRLGVFS